MTSAESRSVGLSKVFKYCLIDRFQDFLIVSDNQFGFKKRLNAATLFLVFVK